MRGCDSSTTPAHGDAVHRREPVAAGFRLRRGLPQAEACGGDYRAMDVLRWKEVIETLEEALDGLENVANAIESVVLKHA